MSTKVFALVLIRCLMAGAVVWGAAPEEPSTPWVDEIEGPQYFAVLAADVDVSERWYARALGLEPLDRWASDDGTRKIVNLGNDRLSVELILDPRAQAVERPLGFFKVGFRVPDVDRVADRVEQATGERPRVVESEAHGVRILQLRDPDGNILQLTSPLASAD